MKAAEFQMVKRVRNWINLCWNDVINTECADIRQYTVICGPEKNREREDESIINMFDYLPLLIDPDRYFYPKKKSHADVSMISSTFVLPVCYDNQMLLIKW